MSLVHNTLTPDIETASENYARRFAGPVGSFFLSVQEKTVAQLLEHLPRTPLKVLEVGGGHTQLTVGLLKTGHSVTVQGSSAESLSKAAALQADYPGQLETVVSDLWKVPYPDKAFDVVIAVRLLAHVERWQELLQEMSRLASHAVIVDFASKSALNVLSPLLFRLKRGIEGNTRPYFSYHPHQINQAMQELGFSLTEGRRQFFFPMGLHRALKQAGLSRVLETVARSAGLTSLLGSPAINLYTRSPRSLTPREGKI